MADPSPDYLALQARWANRWPEALAIWSRYTRLSDPRWCLSEAEATREGLQNSFAMIRLTDHAVVLNLAEITRQGVEGFPMEIMGHEIGHHLFCPGDLSDHGRMLARMRTALKGREDQAPFIANLYSDLLINDRLQRSSGLDMAGVYQRLKGGAGLVWTLYMRIYEVLWGLSKGTLATLPIRPDLEEDARLGARLIRVYARDWLAGAGRFAMLFHNHLLEESLTDSPSQDNPWLDTREIGAGGDPFGLTEVDPEEQTEAIHPRDDPNLNGEADQIEPKKSADTSQGRVKNGGQKNADSHRGPAEYGALLHDMGTRLSTHEVAMRYYRERSLPHLIPFPTRDSPRAMDPMPESLALWEVGEPLEEVDWLESVVRNPTVIPGVTTLQRTVGEVQGFDPGREVVNLYVGIDCSGSMPNPQMSLSYPVLAGTILSLSALRAGASVMACLSGEPGNSIATNGFTRSEPEVMALLSGYLGTGYSYGIFRLLDMVAMLRPGTAPTHVLILSDSDLFSSLDEKKGGGWQVAEQSLAKARGGGTVVLHMPGKSTGFEKQVGRLTAMGWQVHRIASWEELLRFATVFSRLRYGRPGRGA